MNALDGLPLQVLAVHALLVLIPVLVLIMTTFWLLARRRLAKAAHLAGVVHSVDDLFNPEQEDTTPRAARR